MAKKLWGGRFEKETNSFVNEFNASINFDKNLYRHDIEGSIAHVKMLGKQSIIPVDEAMLIAKTLQEILEDIENEKIEFSLELEDIHTNIENFLIERIGDVGKKLHTGRSRNDQVALDLKLFTRQEIDDIKNLVVNFMEALISLSEENLDTVMCGYTHLQKAQPITLSHHFMAYFEMLKRDYERLCDCRKRMNVSPLGSGALAGTTHDLDRNYVAELLGFDDITLNSLDGVSDRDYVIELLSALSLIMVHLSRFAEELIIWNTLEFGYIDLDDAYSTGSSLMPQKKNPDILELIRGKTGRVYGSLISMLTTMKALPLAYNKDMQEDKEPVFDAIKTVKDCLKIFPEVLLTMTVKKENMNEQAKKGFTNATDLADYLVRKKVPFREAHEIVGKIVVHCISKDISLNELPIEEFKKFSAFIKEDVYEALDLQKCISEKSVIGSPSKVAVGYAIEQNKIYLDKIKSDF